MPQSNQYTVDKAEIAKRWQAVSAYFNQHGAVATAKRFGISRTRVYVLVNKLRNGAQPRRQQKP